MLDNFRRGAVVFVFLAAGAWVCPLVGSAAPDGLLAKAGYDDPNGNTDVVCQDDATQSYELYIPHSAPTTEPAPILYGFDPGGNGKGTLLALADATSANGWIVAVSNNSRNGPWSDIFAAQDAVLRDTEQRLNLHPSRRFAAGLSGGARTSLALAFRYPAKICGTLLLAAGWPVDTDLLPSTKRLNVCIIIGTQDSNYTYDIPDTQGRLVAYGIRCIVQTFNGGHEWPPANLVLSGCQWLNANAELDPNAGLPPMSCPGESLFCQLPPQPASGWSGYISDTWNMYSTFEAFDGVTAPIAQVHWWGITATYNSYAGYWLPCDPGSGEFRIRFYVDDGGRPGAAVYDHTVTAARRDLPGLYNRNYALREYSATLSAPVTLASGWIGIEQVSDSDRETLWLNSPTGNGQALQYSESGGDYTPLEDNLAVSLNPEELDVRFAACPAWGKPPLTAAFTSNVTGNAEAVAEWRWDFGDGVILEGGEANPTHVYDHEGTYTVSLTVSTALSNATKIQQDMIVVSQSLPLTMPATVIMLVITLLPGGLVVIRRKRIAH